MFSLFLVVSEMFFSFAEVMLQIPEELHMSCMKISMMQRTL
jgi:hypothetical protein